MADPTNDESEFVSQLLEYENIISTCVNGGNPEGVQIYIAKANRLFTDRALQLGAQVSRGRRYLENPDISPDQRALHEGLLTLLDAGRTFIEAQRLDFEKYSAEARKEVVTVLRLNQKPGEAA